MAQSRIRTLVSGVAAGVLALGCLITTAGAAAADTQLGECLVVDNPTPAAHTECAGLDLGDPNDAVFDFSYADLSDTSVRGGLSGSTFVDADLTGARWGNWGHLVGSDLTGATMDGIDLYAIIADDAIFDNASLVGARLGGTSIYRGTSFVGADLTDADFTAAIFQFFGEPTPLANFTDATLTGADFSETNVVPFPPRPVPATGPDGASVTWDPPVDELIGLHLGECSASGLGTVTSGSTFPLGTTTVSCQVVSTANGTFGAGLFEVEVTPSSDTTAPAITSPDSAAFVAGSAGAFEVVATGNPTPALSIEGALPQGLTFLDNGNGIASLSGTAAPGSGGTYPVTLVASNGVEPSATQNLSISVTEAAESVEITSAAGTTFTVGNAGSFTVQTTGSPTPSLSVTGALPGGVSFVDNGDGTATLAGSVDVGTGGVYPVEFTATVGAASDVQSFTLTVTQAPAITSDDHVTFTTGQTGAFTPVASGYPTPEISVDGALPAGLTFADGVLSGSPSAGSGGDYPVLVTAANDVDPAATQTLTITVNESLSITSAPSTTFTAGTAGTFTVEATGSSTPALTVSGALPEGVGFVDNGDGTATLAGSADAGSGGVHEVELTATVGEEIAHQSFTLTVTEAPSITTADRATFTVGASDAFAPAASGYPTPEISLSGDLPAGLTFADGAISGIPMPGAGGEYPLTVTAANGVGTDATQPLTVTVNEGPSITSGANATFTVGSETTFTVTTSGTPTPSVSSTGALPTGVSVEDNGDGTATLSGTPVAGTGGVYPLELAATAGDEAGVQSFTLTVNEAPAITSADHVTFTVGEQGAFTPAASGFPGPVIAVVGQLPAGLTFTEGTLSGSPSVGAGGDYLVTLTASNGVDPDAVQELAIGVDEGPSITSAESTTFTVGSAGSFTVLTEGTPAAAIAADGALPEGVELTDNGDGTATLAGTPAALTGGRYAITFTAANGIGTDATQEFTLTVDEAPAITSPDHGELTIATDGSIAVQTSGYPAAVLTADGTLPDGVTFVDNRDGTATIGGAPAAGAGGSFTIDITADNGVAPAAVQEFTLTIALVETTTTLTVSPNPVVAGEAMSLTVMVDPPPGPPTGTVEFFDGTVSLGSAVLTAISSTTSTTTLTTTAPDDLGTHSITAVYSGDSSYASSTSAAVEYDVVAAPTPADPDTPADPGDDSTPPVGSGDGPGGGASLPDTGVQIGSLPASAAFLGVLGLVLIVAVSRLRRPRRV